MKSNKENLNLLSIEELSKLSKEELLEIALRENRIAYDLWQKLNQNSDNSSRPPSTDPIDVKLDKSDRRKHKNRTKSNKKSGGQLGHTGKTLTTQTPTKIIKVYSYNLSVKAGTILKSCQVIDIVTKREVIEYQLIATKTKSLKTLVSKLPNHNTVYSNNIKAQVSYLSCEHAISEDRIIRLFKDLYEVEISKGSITNFLTKTSNLLDPVNKSILTSIQKAKILGADETFLSLNGKLGFLWNWQNEQYSYFVASESRKYSNIDQTLKGFNGVLVSDRYSAHLKYGSKHQLCTVHLQRNIKALVDSEIKEGLLNIIGEAQKAEINKSNYLKYNQKFKQLLTNIPQSIDQQTKKLVKSLLKHQKYIFQFLLNPEIPHHNNGTERELRKSKVKSKVSGCFRTLKGFETYASILTFIQTARKQGQNVYQELQNLHKKSTLNLRFL